MQVASAISALDACLSGSHALFSTALHSLRLCFCRERLCGEWYCLRSQEVGKSGLERKHKHKMSMERVELLGPQPERRVDLIHPMS